MNARTLPLALAAALAWAATSPGAPDDTPLLRKRVGVVFDAGGSGPSAIQLTSRPMANYTTPLTYSVIDAQSRLLDRGIVALGARRKIDLPAALGGLGFADLDSWLNGYHLQINRPYAFLASRERNLRVNSFSGDLHFYVPQGCKWFAMRVVCESPHEGAQVGLIGPDGAAVAGASGEIPVWERLRVKPAKEQCGRVWAIRISKHEGLQLDDVDLFLEGDLTPVVALSAAWAERIATKLAGHSGRATGDPRK